MGLTQNTYTPKRVCYQCRLNIQKVMICKESENEDGWDCVRTLTQNDIDNPTPKTLAQIVAKHIGMYERPWMILIFLYGYGGGGVSPAPPCLIWWEE